MYVCVGLCSLHDAMMRTSYNSHYEMPLNQDTNVLLIEDNPSILENEEEDEEGTYVCIYLTACLQVEYLRTYMCTYVRI